MLAVLALVIPFFLGAALHLSAVFKIFSVLPLIFVFLRFGRAVGILASISNLAIVWLLLGRTEAAWFFVLGMVFAITVSECVRLKLRPEWVVLSATGMLLLAAVMLLMSYSHRSHKGPIELVVSYVSSEVDEFIRGAERYRESTVVTSRFSSQDLEKMLADPEMTKRNILEAAPSVILISLLYTVVANLLLLLRLNVQNIRDALGLDAEFFKRWKAPDHMVWPTLAAGFCLVIEIPAVSAVALNLFRVLMAVYLLQGLAIMAALFESWKIKGAFRPLGYALAVTFLLPLVVSLGFFDLWFSFRERIGAA